MPETAVEKSILLPAPSAPGTARAVRLTDPTPPRGYPVREGRLPTAHPPIGPARGLAPGPIASHTRGHAARGPHRQTDTPHALSPAGSASSRGSGAGSIRLRGVRKLFSEEKRFKIRFLQQQNIERCETNLMLVSSKEGRTPGGLRVRRLRRDSGETKHCKK